MPIKNVKDLRDDLLKKYESAKSESDKKDLNTFTQSASAIIRSLKVELDYQKHHERQEKIEFLEQDES